MKEEFYQEKYTSSEVLPLNIQDGEFEDCLFTNIDFKTFDLSYSKFVDCKFISCDLSNVKMSNGRMISSHFEHCKLIGLDWTQLDDLLNPTYETCMMSFSNFTGLKLKRASFQNCVLHDADFLQTDLSESVLSGSDLLNARFEETNLMKSNFTKAINYQINPTTNRIKGAKFSLSEAIGLLTGFDITIE